LAEVTESHAHKFSDDISYNEIDRGVDVFSIKFKASCPNSRTLLQIQVGKNVRKK